MHFIIGGKNKPELYTVQLKSEILVTVATTAASLITYLGSPAAMVGLDSKTLDYKAAEKLEQDDKPLALLTPRELILLTNDKLERSIIENIYSEVLTKWREYKRFGKSAFK